MENLTTNITERARRSVSQKTTDFAIFIEVGTERETILQHPVLHSNREELDRNLYYQLKLFSDLYPESTVCAAAVDAAQLTEAEKTVLDSYLCAENLVKMKFGDGFQKPKAADESIQFNIFDFMDDPEAKDEADRIRDEKRLENLQLTGLVGREQLVTPRGKLTVRVYYEPYPLLNYHKEKGYKPVSQMVM